MGRRRRRARFPKRYCTIDYLECIDYNKQGRGIVMFNDKQFFVDELIKGELAKILVYYEEESHGIARAIDIKEPAKNRVLPLGHWKFSMGSYQIPHMSNDAQDEFKNNRVKEYFPNANKIIVGERTNYRNKVSLSDGGFMPPGRGRRYSIKPENFDLMKIDFDKYSKDKGVTVIRRLDTQISGKPGTKLSTTDTMFDKKFTVSLDAFYQVNSEMSMKVYKKLISFIPDGSIIYDLFGGAATIGIIASDKAKKVYSVEINRTSHADALLNIENNKISNVKAILGDANKFIVDSKEKPDIIIVDPARAGLTNDSCNALNESSANRIIYLSCNIDTQIRDIKLISNFKVTYVQPYDFFPQTFHIENLVILDRK